MQAQKVSRKAAAVGFEWETVQDVWEKVAEERAEFEAEAPGSPEREMEFGDLLFALVNVARKEGIDAESGKVPPSLGRDGADGGRCSRGSCRAFDSRPQRPVGCRKGGGVRLRERRADMPHRSR